MCIRDSFLADPEAAEFEIAWNAEAFENGRAEMCIRDRYFPSLCFRGEGRDGTLSRGFGYGLQFNEGQSLDLYFYYP